MAFLGRDHLDSGAGFETVLTHSDRDGLNLLAVPLDDHFVGVVVDLHDERTTHLEVDGGVTPANIREIAEAGADMFVAGSAIFGKPDYKAVIDEMRAELALAGSQKA